MNDHARRFSRLEQLSALEQIWSGCQRCELSNHRSKLVHFRGSANAPLFIIGEAPGADEDQQGLPFVGMPGRKLDEILKAVGLRPAEDVFMVNTVACRPPGNRFPTRDEKNTCSPRLEAMLRIVNPKAILLMGASAAKLAGVNSVTRRRGERLDFEMWIHDKLFVHTAVCTFHPAHLLRMGSPPRILNQMGEDIKLAWSFTRG